MATYWKDADLTGLFVDSPAADRRTKNLAEPVHGTGGTYVAPIADHTGVQ